MVGGRGFPRRLARPRRGGGSRAPPQTRLPVRPTQGAVSTRPSRARSPEPTPETDANPNGSGDGSHAVSRDARREPSA